MIKTEYSSRYLSERKKFLKNNVIALQKTIKAIEIFVQNPNHPSLHLEKLQGTNIWTIRIDQSNRIFFNWINEEKVLFIDIGKHDKYSRY
jgi:plasmid maintenance system killer protein